MFSFLCIVKQKKNLERSEIFWKLLFLKIYIIKNVWKVGFQFMLILVLLGMYFDAVVVFVTKSSLLFRFAVAILCGSKTKLMEWHIWWIDFCSNKPFVHTIFQSINQENGRSPLFLYVTLQCLKKPLTTIYFLITIFFSKNIVFLVGGHCLIVFCLNFVLEMLK